MAMKPIESQQEQLTRAASHRRAFLRDGLSLVGGTALASVALDMLRDPAPAFGGPPSPRPDKQRSTCLAVAEVNKILTCDDGKRVFLWTPKPGGGGGFKKDKFFREHAKKASYVGVSGDTVLTASHDGHVFVRSLADQNDMGATDFDQHILFDTTGRVEVWVAEVSALWGGPPMALSGDNFGNIFCWNPTDLAVFNAFRDGSEWVGALAFMAALPHDGKVLKRFLSGHEDGKMLLWDITDVPANASPGSPITNPVQAVRHIFPHDSNKYPVNAVAVTTDTTTNIAVSGNFDGKVRMWRVGPNNLVQPGQNNPHFNEIAHAGVIWRIAIDPHNNKFATASQYGNDGMVRLFRISDGKEWEMNNVPQRKPVTGGVMGVGFNGDQQVVYTTGDATGDDHFGTWDVPATIP